jgi:hypothetical protein
MEAFTQITRTLAELDPQFYLLGAILIGMVVLIYASILSVQMRVLQKKYNILLSGSSKKNIGEIFDDYFERIEEMLSAKDLLQAEINEVKALAEAGLHHIGIVRYSAYDDVGGDLSFSLALLDGDYSGVLVTSIFARNESRTYAKPITRMESTYKLTHEEQEALRRAALPRTFTRRGSKKNAV